MRRILIAVLLALAACDAPQSQLRQVTIESPEALGLSLRELPSSALRSVGLAYGLSVIKAGSLAERAGVRVGDIVFAVNQQPFSSKEEFEKLIGTHKKGEMVALLVRRGEISLYVPVEIG